MDKNLIENLLVECWSSETSTLYSKNNPARGQCDVTAIVIYEYFGGEILKTFINEQPHFYNRINGDRYDFTASQFQILPDYLDLPSTREEILNINFKLKQQYKILRERFEKLLLKKIVIKRLETKI
ncbi:MAG: hypothetical protein HC874_02830 [Richelia sp. SL_2_1]|nr:hypothetical protein [Richelia sp. SM1_7_0]NJO26578.1 hypothetical protein [Richelia sp. SL_2_1]